MRFYEGFEMDPCFSLIDLIGSEKVQKFQKRFYEATGFTNSYFDAQGKLISRVGEPAYVCMNLIRENEEGRKRCVANDIRLTEDTRTESEEPLIYKCHAGIWHASVQIIADGQTLGFVFIGQCLTEPPNKTEAKSYAEELGIDPGLYWEHFRKLPIVPYERIENTANLLLFMVTALAEEASGKIKARQETDKLGRTEAALIAERAQLLSIFESINQIIYVADPQSYEILYVNRTLREAFKKDLVGGICYKEFQGLESPCEFCTNKLILENKHEPYQWEYHNPILDRDYMIVDRIIRWPDGRDVRFEIAMDISKQKRTEKALRESEEKYRNLVDLLPIGMFQTDDKGILIYANKAFFEMLEYPEAILEEGFDCLQALVPEDRDRAINTLSKILSGESFGGTEYTAITKNGVKLPILVHSSRVSSKNRAIQHGVVIDISKRKEAERKIFRHAAVLKGINRIFRKVLHDTTDEALGEVCLSVAEELTGSKVGFIGEIGKDGLLHHIAISQPGWEACGMMDQSGHRTPPGDFQIQGIYGRVLKDGKGFFINDLSNHSDRIGLPAGHPPLTAFLGVPLILEERTIGMIGMGNRDGGYTDEEQESLESLAPAMVEAFTRKRAEEALKSSEELFRDMVDKLPFPLVVATADNKTEYANPRFTEVFGYTLEDIPDQEAWREKFFPDPEYRAAISREVDDWIAKKDFLKAFDRRYMDKWGREHDVIITVIHLKDRFYNIVEDITERKQAEEEREKLQSQLQQTQKMEAISTLAGGIAHEFNNALMGILGNIELLKMDLPEDEGRERYFEAMKGSGHRMSRLTSKLLAYSQGGKYSPKNLKLDYFVMETLPILQHHLKPTVRVETHFRKGISYIRADHTQMQMVLSAILTNSNEAIEDEGLIRITAKDRNIDEDFIKQHPGLKPGPYVCLTIDDDGKGMDEETSTRIFEPFFTTKFQGRGMGMAAVYGIVMNHDGWISVDSELGKGTVVRIYLPAIEIELKKSKKDEAEVATGTGTILMIEDEDVVIEVTQAMLEWLGYRVMVAKTGKDAVHITETFDGNIDLALLDIKLPDMEGGKVYPLIMEARPDLKVIVFSGYAIDGPARKILDAGAQDFIQKPFSLSALSEKLKEVLEGK